MSISQNRELHLVARPLGLVKASDFALVLTAIPEPGPGQALVRTSYLSLDAALRMWMSERELYWPPVALGEVMRCIGIGQVVRSNNPGYKVGSLVQGLVGWRDYLLVGEGTGHELMPIDALPGVALPVMLGTLGFNGLTGYVGLTEIGKAQPGETVVVSAAAGATGSAAAQIAKLLGCRTVGIAGSEEKCDWLKELGIDAAINYKRAGWQAELGRACPQGIDVVFENVGGELLDASLARLNLQGRVVLCGLIASYGAEAPVPGPFNLSYLLTQRACMRGFIVTDYAALFPEALGQLVPWFLSGRLKHRDTIVEGLENAPQAVNRLFEGSNIGKLLIKVAEPSLPPSGDPSGAA